MPRTVAPNRRETHKMRNHKLHRSSLWLALSLALVLTSLPPAAMASLFPYEWVSATGDNNERDVVAGACDFDQGCYDKNGILCSDDPDEVCDLNTVPKGRCSAGFSDNVWPQRTGQCVGTFGYFVRDDLFIATDPFDPDAARNFNPQMLEKTFRNTQVAPSGVPCLSDDYVAALEAGDQAQLAALEQVSGPSTMCGGATCDMGTNDNAANCQGDDPSAANWEGTVCGVLQAARCSDGDPELDIGGLGISLCTDLHVGPLNISSASNCGNNAGTKPNPGSPRDILENPPRLFTGQRTPGGGFLGTGVIRRPRSTAAIDIQSAEDADTNTLSIRKLSVLAQARWTDAVYSASQANGSLDQTRVSLPCTLPNAWESQLPVQGSCSGDPDRLCIQDAPDCNGAGSCINKLYCHEAGAAQDGLGFLWQRDIVDGEAIPDGLPAQYRDPNGNPLWSTDPNGATCPPVCGTAYDHTTFEQEAIRALASQDRAAAQQVSLDELKGRRAGAGDLIFIESLTEAIWVNKAFSNPPTGDLRCVIGGLPGRADPNDGKVGVCSLPDANGNFETCDPTNNGGLCSVGNHCLTCSGPSLLDDPTKGSARALPVGYDDLGFDSLKLNGRLGVRSDFAADLALDFFLVGTTGAVAAEFTDDPVNDFGRQVLGESDPNQPGSIGIGTGGCFAAGQKLAHGGSNKATDPNGNPVAVCWPPEDAPAPGNSPFVRTGSFGAGANGIPGCIGDSNAEASAAQACNQRLGKGLNANGQWGFCGTDVFMDPNGPPILCETNDNPLNQLDFRSSYCWQAGTSKILANMEVCNEETDVFPVNTGEDDVAILMPVEDAGVPVEGVQAHFRVPNPSAPNPILHYVAAASARDLDVILTDSVDILLKADATACPISPSTGSFDCSGQAADCDGAGGDTDDDGLCDDDDNCPDDPNPSQADSDDDGIGNVCEPLDHFMLYDARRLSKPRRFERFGPVTLADQFGSGDYEVRKLDQLGLPADKNSEGRSDDATHLAEYRIRAVPGGLQFFPQKDLQVLNQCTNLTVDARRPTSLLVPTAKDLANPVDAPSSSAHNVDHFLCYSASAQGRLPSGIQVDVEDQFQTRRYDLTRLTKLCNPVDKSGDPVVLVGPNQGTPKPIAPASIRNPEDHLACYRAKLSRRFIAQNGCGAADPSDRGTPIVQAPTLRVKGVHLNNQFGELEVNTRGVRELCIPSLKFPMGVPPAPGTN